MENIGAYEAKTRLPALLERVARGERITITKHGMPVAVLQPVEGSGKLTVEEAIREMRALGKGRASKGVNLKELLEEGRD